MRFAAQAASCLLPLFFFLANTPVVSAEEFKLEQLVSDKDKFLAISAENFIDKENRIYFNWLSEEKKEAHFPGYSNSPPLSFFGLKAWESNVRFKDGKIDSLMISVYNRGDAGEIMEDSFNGIRNSIDAKLAEWAGTKGIEHKKTKVAGCDLNTKAWVKDDAISLVLRWSSTGRSRDFRAEYISIEFSPFNPKEDPRKTPPSAYSLTAPKAASSKEIKSNIVRKEDGDVFLDNLPMVDQGQKGYCAAATAERILRYYGMEVTQHVLAQIMNTDSDEGTDSDKMLKSLQRAGTKYGVKLRTHYDWKMTEFQKTISSYNRLARKAKKREVNLQSSAYKSLTDVYKDLDLDLFKKTKIDSEKADYKGFLTDIHKHVDEGIPLFWGVTLGIVKEEGLPQVFGGHMRIIIGYNDKNKEIIYTDSWGKGHEFKKISADDAWVMTTGLYSYDPKR